MAVILSTESYVRAGPADRGPAHHGTFELKNPYDKPEKLCTALWHVLQLYAWRMALGFPSWEADDATAYRLHCPSKTGTVWEMRKAPAQEVS